MGDFKLGKPAKSGGNKLDKAEHLDHLFVAVDPKEVYYEQTQNGPGSAAVCRYYVCLGCGGKVWEDVPVWGTVVVPQLTEGLEELLPGVMTQQTSQKGRAFYSVEEPTPEQEAEVLAWLQVNARRYGSDLPTPLDHPELEGKLWLDQSHQPEPVDESF